MRRTRRASRLAVLLTVGAMALTACSGETTTEDDLATEGQDTETDAGTDTETDAGSDTETDDGDTGGGGDEGVLVVGTTEKPSTIDPAEAYEKMASDFLFNTTDR